MAHRLWAVADRPRVDRFLGRPDVVHGTNYVVPPCRAPRVVSVYDCWFLHHPTLATQRCPTQRAGAAPGHRQRRNRPRLLGGDRGAGHELFPVARVATIPLAPLPVPEPPVESPLPSLGGRPFIAAIGTLERRKNLPVLVEAFGLAAAENHELVLVLAGADGDDRPRVNAAIDALDPAAARRVIMTRRVDEPTRSWLLHHAAVLAYPSLDEGFGFPLLDAMQIGVPIVASNAGASPRCAERRDCSAMPTTPTRSPATWSARRSTPPSAPAC